MLKQILFALIVGTVSLTIASCGVRAEHASDTIRYKVTVTVETPEGIKAGSAVREAVHYTERSILPDQGGTFYNITKGEAVVVDLGQRGVLFVLMAREAEARAVFKNHNQKIIDKFSFIEGKSPVFVFFKDRNDANSVQEVSLDDTVTHGRYGNRAASLGEAFGEGVFMKGILVELYSTEKDTTLIMNYLPWLQKIKGYIDGSFAGGGPELANIIDKGDFVRGAK